MALACGLVAGALSCGPALPGYVVLYRHVEALRPCPDPASINFLPEVGGTRAVIKGPVTSNMLLVAFNRFPELQLSVTDGNRRTYVLAVRVESPALHRESS